MPLGETLAGRELELAELESGLERLLAGRGALFMVVGEPGVGKTALAEAVAAEAGAAGVLVLWGRAWGRGGAPAFWPWLGILRRLASERDVRSLATGLGPHAAARLSRLVPDLRAGSGPAAGDASEPDPATSGAGRFELFDAVTSLLRASAATDGPLVIVLDDLQGADHPTLLLLGFLAAKLRDTPILVIGTYREAEARLDARLAATLGDITRHGRRLPLRGLPEHDVGAFVERVAGRRPPEPIVRAIHDATEGNPFFIDEVVQLLSAEGRLDDPAAVVGVPIPDGVRETIRQRLDPLAERTRTLLMTAAVIGRSFSLGTLQRVCELEPADLDRALGEAVGSGIIVERPGALGSYGFSHGLIGDTLYDDLGAPRRAHIHRAVGLALEQLHAADIEQHVAELAHHFFAAANAGEIAKAIDYCVRAGERALELVAYEDACRHFEKALQAYGLQDRADVTRHCDLLLALATAQSRAGDARGARETFMRAARLARELRLPERLARAALGYGAGLSGVELGRVDETLVALLQEARDALVDGAAAGPHDSALLARVLGRLATELSWAERSAERVELSEQAVAMARRLDDRAALGATLSARFLILCGPGDIEQRLRIASEVVALGEEVRDRELVLHGHARRIVTLMELGDWVGVDIELAVHERLTEQLRDPLHRWYVPLFAATRALLDGRLADAERFAGEAFAVGGATRAERAAQLHAVQLFALRAEQGRMSEIDQALEELGRRSPAAPVWRAAAAFALAAGGRSEDARRAFEALAGEDLTEIPLDGEWLASVSLLVATGARIGDARRTARLGDLLIPYLDRAVIAGRGAICLGPVARFAGMAAAAAGRTGESIGHLDRALATARRWGAGPILAAIALELAELLENSDAPRARALREEGLAAARRLELGGLIARWDAVEPRGPPVAGPVAAPEAGSALDDDGGGWAFYRRGDIWTIGPPGGQVRLRHAKGLSQIARLLAAPGVEFHALDLVIGPQDRGAPATLALAAGIEVRPRGAADAGPVLDAEAKRAYRQRLSDLRQEIEQAEDFNDPERAARAREERELVAHELAGAVGLGGRDRRARSDAERARVNVTRAIRSALNRIGERDPALARRLGNAIRTGTFCAYDPTPGDEPAWDLRGPA